MIFCHRLRNPLSVGGHTGWQPRHLLAEGADGTLLGAAPCYVKTPFARRIRLRPRLGRGLRARRRRLLPQAAGGGAVHAGDRPAPARPPRPAGRSRARRPRRCAGRDHHRERAVLGPRHLPDRAGMARCSASAASCSAPTSNSIGRMPATRVSTTSSPPSPRASARPSAASARRRLSPASRWPGSPAPTSPKRCGTPFSPSTWTPARANGAGLI